MVAEHQRTFGPFRLDLAQGRLWQGTAVDGLAPAVAGAAALSRRASPASGPQSGVAAARVGGTHVSDTVLRVCVQEIRAALGDAAAVPRYLATVGRQGYRFLGDDRALATPEVPDPAGPIVGRQAEVAAVERWFQQAADNATRRNAHHEAVTALTQGLALLATLPESPEWAQHELTLLLLLGPRLMAAQGHAVPAVLPPGVTPPGPAYGAGGLYGPGADRVLSGRLGHSPEPSGAQSAPLRRAPIPPPTFHRRV